MSRACALGAGQQLAGSELQIAAPQWHVEDDFPHGTITAGGSSRETADQSDHGGHESAGPLSSFWLRGAVSVTAMLL